MKSAIYMGKENVKVIDVPIPVCGDDDVLIKNLYSSVCGTDAAVYKYGPDTGHKITLNSEFGHETVSRVVAVGKNVIDFKVGERVYPYPLYAKGDTSRAGTIGGFSEYILIPNAKRNYSLYPVSDSVSDKTACLIEPFTIACRAVRRSRPENNESAVVFGCGTIGIACAVILQFWGIKKIMLCDISDYRLNIASDLDFKTCNTAKESFAEKAEGFFKTAKTLNGDTFDADIFIDAAGDESVFEMFMSKGKIGSRFVSVAVNKSIRKLDLLSLTYSQKSIIGSGGYMPEDVKTVFELMESGKWNIESIITHEYSIDNISYALETASQTDKSLNVVIKFEDGDAFG